MRNKALNKRTTFVIFTVMVFSLLYMNMILRNPTYTILNGSFDSIQWKHLATKLYKGDQTNITSEPTLERPDKYVHASRFDIIVKIVYAYFVVYMEEIPKPISLAYTEHIRAFNNFYEGCHIDKRLSDFNKPCKQKRSKKDFVDSFHSTIKDIQKNGFNQSKSIIPIDKSGSVINGAHRMATVITLSKRVVFQHTNFTAYRKWDYKFFQERGLNKDLMDLVVLEYMKIQIQLNLTTKLSIISIYDIKLQKDLLRCVKRHCSRDGFVVYQKNIYVPLPGMKQLLYHTYGRQNWIDERVSQMKMFNERKEVVVLFVLFFMKNQETCKDEINLLFKKSDVHLCETPVENLLISEIIFNKNFSFLPQLSLTTRKNMSQEITKRSM